MKENILTLLKKNSGFASGQSIADTLKITRNAVHKHIKSLRESGYLIESKHSLGYRLLDDSNFIDDKSLAHILRGHLFSKSLVHLKSIGSTNDEAYRLAEEGAPEGTVVISERQTKGKGRLGRSWESAAPTNLYFSVVLRPKVIPSYAPRITVLTALSIAAAIEETAKLTPKIKWPNDILIGDKKLCGILTEMKSESDMIDFIIVGIGVNVNSTRSDFEKSLRDTATTLKDESQKMQKRQELLVQILINLEKWYGEMMSGKMNKMTTEWKRYSYLFGRRVTLENINERFSGTALGIDDDGFLLLESGGETRRVFSGTVVGVE